MVSRESGIVDEAGARHQPPYPLDDLVVWGYRLLLDRDPEDPAVVARMRDAFPSSIMLRRAFFTSAPEFAAGDRQHCIRLAHGPPADGY